MDTDMKINRWALYVGIASLVFGIVEVIPYLTGTTNVSQLVIERIRDPLQERRENQAKELEEDLVGVWSTFVPLETNLLKPADGVAEETLILVPNHLLIKNDRTFTVLSMKNETGESFHVWGTGTYSREVRRYFLQGTDYQFFTDSGEEITTDYLLGVVKHGRYMGGVAPIGTRLEMEWGGENYTFFKVENPVVKFPIPSE